MFGLWLAPCFVGCSMAATAPAPRDTLRRASEAAARGDATALYDMLPAAARRAETREAFEVRLRADRAELAVFARALDLALRANGGPMGDVRLRAGGAAVVVAERDGWRMSDTGFGAPTGVTLEGITGARAAVRSLHTTLRLHGAGAWVQALSARAAGNVEAEVAALMEATEDPTALAYTDQHTRVTFTLPDGRKLDVVFEAGAWRIDALRDP